MAKHEKQELRQQTLNHFWASVSERVNVLHIPSLKAGVVIAELHLGNFGEGTPEELEALGYVWHSPVKCSVHELRKTEG